MPLPLKILYAEDDNDDYIFIEQAFKEIAPQYTIIHTHTGMETVELLKDSEAAELPSLIILDFNMPKWNALKTLEQLQTNQKLKNIPKVVYSNGNYYKQIEACLALGAQSFISKGSTLQEIRNDVQ